MLGQAGTHFLKLYVSTHLDKKARFCIRGEARHKQGTLRAVAYVSLDNMDSLRMERSCPGFLEGRQPAAARENVVALLCEVLAQGPPDATAAASDYDPLHPLLSWLVWKEVSQGG